MLQVLTHPLVSLVLPVLLFNLEELIWSWKLFEYIQFCHERFRNRSRRWVGLDTTINEELPPDLRAMDQMCLSIQFFMLGSLHASGIVMAVLGYMLVLHKSHNIFGDPMVIPIFFVMTLAFNFGKRLVLRFADRFQIWMVEGEKEHEEVYDEGPGSRQAGELPPGMAAVDATIAECIEDAFAVGYTDETLSKLLTEAILYIPPGSSIQAAGGGPGGGGMASTDQGAQPVSQEQMDMFLRMQAQGLIPSSAAPGSFPGGGGMYGQFQPGQPPNAFMGGGFVGGAAGMGPMGCGPMGCGPMLGMPGAFNGASPGFGAACGFPQAGAMGDFAGGCAGGYAAGGYAAGGYPGPGAPGMPSGPSLPPGVPPPPLGGGRGGAGEDGTFKDFMDAFRTEMWTYVPSTLEWMRSSRRRTLNDRQSNESRGAPTISLGSDRAWILLATTPTPIPMITTTGNVDWILNTMIHDGNQWHLPHPRGPIPRPC